MKKLLFIDTRYKLKEGAEPTFGHAPYGTDNLEILAIDTDDSTIMVRPAGFSQSATFWASADDLVEEA